VSALFGVAGSRVSSIVRFWGTALDEADGEAAGFGVAMMGRTAKQGYAEVADGKTNVR
jgi:hypothetical protein